MQIDENSNRKIVSGVIWKFGERVIAQGVSFFVSLILARILLPEDYGAVAVVTVFIEIANILLSSGLNVALIQKKDITQEEISTVFYCNLLLSLLLYVIMYAAAPYIANRYQLEILIPVLRVFALRLPIAAFQSIQCAIVSRNLEFKKFFLSTIGGTLCSAVVGIVMAVKGYGVWALVWQYLTNTIIDTLILAITVRWRPTMQFSMSAARPLISYGWKIMITDFIGTVFNNLSSMIIGVRYTTTDLAYYTKGKQLPYLLRNNIYTTLISVLFPAMAKVSDNYDAMKQMASRSIQVLSYIIYPFMVGMMVIANNLVVLLFTEKWILMVPFIRIVCLECLISIIPTITLQTLKASGYSDVVLRLEFIKKPILLASIFIAMEFDVFAIALTLPVNTSIELVIDGYACRKNIGYNISEQIKPSVSALMLSVVMGLTVKMVEFFELSILQTFICQVGIGVIVYVGLSVIFKVDAFIIIYKIIKEKLPMRR